MYTVARNMEYWNILHYLVRKLQSSQEINKHNVPKVMMQKILNFHVFIRNNLKNLIVLMEKVKESNYSFCVVDQLVRFVCLTILDATSPHRVIEHLQ